MTRLADGRWDIVASVLNRGLVSTHTADVGGKDLHLATCSLEIIRAYSCGAYPGGDHVTFGNNVLTVSGGRQIAPKWVTTGTTRPHDSSL